VEFRRFLNGGSITSPRIVAPVNPRLSCIPSKQLSSGSHLVRYDESAHKKVTATPRGHSPVLRQLPSAAAFRHQVGDPEMARQTE
jgi:hypothetical protein